MRRSAEEETHAMGDTVDQRLREALDTPLSRRTVLRRGGQVAGLAGIGAFLAACSGSSATAAPSGAAVATTSAGAAVVSAAPVASPARAAPAPRAGAGGGRLDFANWPAYIDVSSSGADKGKSPTLLQFQKATGVQVNYQEKIDDNNSFVATIRPQLKAASTPAGT